MILFDRSMPLSSSWSERALAASASALGLFVLACLLFGAPQGFADVGYKIEGARLWKESGKARVVLDLNRPLDFKSFQLEKPLRLAIDLKAPLIDVSALDQAQIDTLNSPIARVRYGRHKGYLRVVLDLRHPVRWQVLKIDPTESYGHRLFIDMDFSSKRAAKTAPRSKVKADAKTLVVVDPGHGGAHHPGAVAHGLREKDLALQISRRLQRQINAAPGYRAILTRNEDAAIDFESRRNLASNRGAKLFLSIHCNSWKNSKPNGFAVYTLSTDGASSQLAQLLADRENRMGLISKFDLGGDKDQIISGVLVDLQMSAIIDESREAAKIILRRAKRVTRLYAKKIEHAPFAVLKSSDVPSVLIEVGFISNPADARRLVDAGYQRQIAKAIAEGAVEYLAQSNLRIQPQFANTRQHVVRRGDTLGEIAFRYGVTIRALKLRNNLRGNTIYPGQRLLVH